MSNNHPVSFAKICHVQCSSFPLETLTSNLKTDTNGEAAVKVLRIGYFLVCVSILFLNTINKLRLWGMGESS